MKHTMGSIRGKKNGNGLTAKQKTLPKDLQEKIMKSKKKKKPLYKAQVMAVNAAGNYTKPKMRKALFNSIKARAVQGTAAGKWSARKAQLLAKLYKKRGGGYT